MNKIFLKIKPFENQIYSPILLLSYKNDLYISLESTHRIITDEITKTTHVYLKDFSKTQLEYTENNILVLNDRDEIIDSLTLDI